MNMQEHLPGGDSPQVRDYSAETGLRIRHLRGKEKQKERVKEEIQWWRGGLGIRLPNVRGLRSESTGNQGGTLTSASFSLQPRLSASFPSV